MLGRQSTIVTTNDDLAVIEQSLRRRGDVQFLSRRTNEGRNTLLPLKTLPVDPGEFGKGLLVCYLARAGEPAEVDIEPLSDVKVRVSVESSEIIEFCRPYCRDGVIQGDRVFYTPRFSEGQGLQDKTPDFVRWAESVMRTIRRSLTYDPKAQKYFGADAARKIATGELKLIP